MNQQTVQHKPAQQGQKRNPLAEMAAENSSQPNSLDALSAAMARAQRKDPLSMSTDGNGDASEAFQNDFFAQQQDRLRKEQEKQALIKRRQEEMAAQEKAIFDARERETASQIVQLKQELEQLQHQLPQSQQPEVYRDVATTNVIREEVGNGFVVFYEQLKQRVIQTIRSKDSSQWLQAHTAKKQKQGPGMPAKGHAQTAAVHEQIDNNEKNAHMGA